MLFKYAILRIWLNIIFFYNCGLTITGIFVCLFCDVCFHRFDLLRFLQVDFEWAVKLNRIALELIGLWPMTVKNSRQNLANNLRVLFVFIGLTFFILVPAIHSLIRIHHDAMLMIDNLQFTLPGISCSIRIIIFWWKKEGRRNYL